jgi:hypothetical protein
MGALSPIMADALDLLDEDLFAHLDQADELAKQAGEWSEQDMDSARQVIINLVLMIRGLLIEHERQPSGDCRTCTTPWPCAVATTIHGFLKDPQRQFATLLYRARQ